MSGVKHTPGPWKIDFGYPRGLPGGISTMNGGRPVTRFNTFARPTSPEALANARLIVAAPDLLEAGVELQAARKAHKLTPSAENLSRVRIASDAFDAAIARARGEQSPNHSDQKEVGNG